MNFHSRIDDERAVLRLGSLPERVRVAILRKVTALAFKLEAKVKGKLSGLVLHVRSGALWRSIFSKVTESPKSIIGTVASSGDVKYAGIHEHGGITRPHEIRPVKAQVLAFLGKGGKQVFARSVQHPGSKMPERSYLRSSLAEMRDEIMTGLKATALQAAAGR